jgi:hypothetical protein
LRGPRRFGEPDLVTEVSKLFPRAKLAGGYRLNQAASLTLYCFKHCDAVAQAYCIAVCVAKRKRVSGGGQFNVDTNLRRRNGENTDAS